MKKENFTLSKKLKQYSALAGSMIAVSGMANAQVVYTDVNPDKVLAGVHPFSNPDTLQLDLNNDGIFDFFLYAFRGSSYSYQQVGAMMPYTAANSNAIAGTLTSLNGTVPLLKVSALPLGENIDSNLPFHNLTDIMFATSQVLPAMAYASTGNTAGAGDWIGVNDHYIGFKFKIGSDFHYGWARCSVAANADTITLKEYAYEATANTGLFAGQGSPLAIADVNQSGNLKIVGYDGTASIFVNDGNMGGAAVTVTNMTGDVVIRQSLSNRITSIDLNQFAKGIYLVTVQRGDEILTKKISFR